MQGPQYCTVFGSMHHGEFPQLLLGGCQLQCTLLLGLTSADLQDERIMLVTELMEAGDLWHALVQYNESGALRWYRRCIALLLCCLALPVWSAQTWLLTNAAVLQRPQDSYRGRSWLALPAPAQDHPLCECLGQRTLLHV